MRSRCHGRFISNDAIAAVMTSLVTYMLHMTDVQFKSLHLVSSNSHVSFESWSLAKTRFPVNQSQ